MRQLIEDNRKLISFRGHLQAWARERGFSESAALNVAERVSEEALRLGTCDVVSVKTIFLRFVAENPPPQSPLAAAYRSANQALEATESDDLERLKRWGSLDEAAADWLQSKRRSLIQQATRGYFPDRLCDAENAADDAVNRFLKLTNGDLETMKTQSHALRSYCLRSAALDILRSPRSARSCAIDELTREPSAPSTIESAAMGREMRKWLPLFFVAFTRDSERVKEVDSLRSLLRSRGAQDMAEEFVDLSNYLFPPKQSRRGPQQPSARKQVSNLLPWAEDREGNARKVEMCRIKKDLRCSFQWARQFAWGEAAGLALS